jgi:hypothetical protein
VVNVSKLHTHTHTLSLSLSELSFRALLTEGATRQVELVRA